MCGQARLSEVEATALGGVGEEDELDEGAADVCGGAQRPQLASSSGRFCRVQETGSRTDGEMEHLALLRQCYTWR